MRSSKWEEFSKHVFLTKLRLFARSNVYSFPSYCRVQTAAETNEHYKYNAMSNREVRDVTYHANYCNENVKKHGIKVLK